MLICDLGLLSTGIIAFAIIDVLFSRVTSLLCVISTLAFNIFIALLKEFAFFASTNAFIPLINIPPIVHYGMHVPVVVSTPTGTEVHAHSSQQEDSYQQIIPGMSQGSLYPTLSSLSSGAVALDDEVQSLCDKVSKGIDKYLQDAEQCHALEVNYFDDTTRPTNTSLKSEATEQVNESSKNNLPPAKQESMEEVESAINIPESLKIATGHTL